MRVIYFCILMLIPTLALADSSVFGSDILRSAKEKDHYQVVLRASERKQLTFAEQIVVARSAWALGLAEEARQLWRDILADREFSGPERDRIVLSSAILELQEDDFDKARKIAETGSSRLEPSNLRAQFFLVIAESLKEQGVLSKAEVYYQRAMEDSQGEVRNEAAYLLGKCQFQLGLLEQARKSFVSVEASSPYGPRSLSKLVEIDLVQKNYEAVLTWIKEGRELYPEDFESEWLRFASISALTELDKVEEAESELKAFKKRYSDLGAWYAISASSIEAGYLRVRLKGEQRAARR